MVHLDKVPALGYETKHISVPASHSATKVTHNIQKVLGYLPGLSLIQGIEHIVMAVKERKNVSQHFIWRGVLEILGLGFLLLIPDLIITCMRGQTVKKRSLEGHKVVPVAVNQSKVVPAAVSFPVKVATFLEKKEESYSPLLDTLELKIKQRIKWMKFKKLRHILEMCPVDYSLPANKAKMKQIILNFADSYSNVRETLVGYLRDRKVLAATPEDLSFYVEVASKISSSSGTGSFIKWLCLDISQPHCFEAMRALSLSAAKKNTSDFLKVLQDLGLNKENAAHKKLLRELAQVCVRHDPYSTFNHIDNFGLTHLERQTFLEPHKVIAGSLTDKREHAAALFAANPSMLVRNLPYYHLHPQIPEECHLLKELIAKCLPEDSQQTFKVFKGLGFDLQKDKMHLADILLKAAEHRNYPCSGFERFGFTTSTPEGLELTRQIVLKQMKAIGVRLFLNNIKEFYLDKDIVEHRAVLLEAALLGIEEDADGILEACPHLGVVQLSQEYYQLYKAASALGETGSLLERKEKALRICLHNGSLARNAKYYFDASKPEEQEVIKQLAIKTGSAYSTNILKDFNFTDADLKEVLMCLATKGKSLCLEIWRWKNDLGLHPNKPEHKAFYREIALKIAAYDPRIAERITACALQASDEQDFAVLKQTALMVASQSGGIIKKAIPKFGFNSEVPEHKLALDEIMAAAIAEDGPKKLDGFGVVTPKKEINLHAMLSNPLIKYAQLGKVKEVLDHLNANLMEVLATENGKKELKNTVCEMASGHPDQAFEVLKYVMKTKSLRLTHETDVPLLHDMAAAIALHDSSLELLDKLLGLFKYGQEAQFFLIFLIYANTYGFPLQDYLKKKSLSPYLARQVALAAAKRNPFQANKYFQNYPTSDLVDLMKSGSMEERLNEAKAEAKASLKSLFLNLPYYNLDAEALKKLFEHVLMLDPKQAIDHQPDFQLWLLDKNFIRYALTICAEKEPKKLAVALNHVFNKLGTNCITDEDFYLSLASSIATQNSEALRDNFGAFGWNWEVTVDQSVVQMVILDCFSNDPKGTLNNLAVFGVPKHDMKALTSYLVTNFKTKFSLEYRFKCFQNALKQFPMQALGNLPYYLVPSSPEDQKALTEVAVELLRKTGKMSFLDFYGVPSGVQAAMLLEAIQSPDCSPSLFDKMIENKSFNELKQIVLCFAKNNPFHVLKKLLEKNLDLKNSEHCNLLFEVYMMAAYQDSTLLMKSIFRMPFALYDNTQYKAAKQIAMVMSKEIGETDLSKLGIDPHTYYGNKIQRALNKDAFDKASAMP